MADPAGSAGPPGSVGGTGPRGARCAGPSTQKYRAAQRGPGGMAASRAVIPRQPSAGEWGGGACVCVGWLWPMASGAHSYGCTRVGAIGLRLVVGRGRDMCVAPSRHAARRPHGALEHHDACRVGEGTASSQHVKARMPTRRELTATDFGGDMQAGLATNKSRQGPGGSQWTPGRSGPAGPARADRHDG
jgi:hypothetical protein